MVLLSGKDRKELGFTLHELVKIEAVSKYRNGAALEAAFMTPEGNQLWAIVDDTNTFLLFLKTGDNRMLAKVTLARLRYHVTDYVPIEHTIIRVPDQYGGMVI